MPMAIEGTALLIEVEDDLHHLKLLFQGHAGIVGVEGVLLEKAHADDLGDFQDKLLVVGQDVGADELYDFHEAALLVQNASQAGSGSRRSFCPHVPRTRLPRSFKYSRIAGKPLDCREMSCVGQVFVQSPETADETLGILRHRLGEIAALG